MQRGIDKLKIDRIWSFDDSSAWWTVAGLSLFF